MMIQLVGYEAVEKIAQAGGNSARLYVPKHWQGKKVKAVLVEWKSKKKFVNSEKRIEN
ncbi:MAG: DUF2080 family transposase-associated protein [archaeon]